MPQKTQQLQNGTNAVYKGSGELVQGIGLLEKQMIPQIEKSVDQVNKNIQESGSQVFDSVKQGADQLKNSTDQLIASIQAATGETTGGKSSGAWTNACKCGTESPGSGSDCTGGSRSGGSSRKYRRILFKRFLTEGSRIRRYGGCERSGTGGDIRCREKCGGGAGSGKSSTGSFGSASEQR